MLFISNKVTQIFKLIVYNQENEAVCLVTDCQLAIIMDLAQTNASHSRQAKLDVLKPWV